MKVASKKQLSGQQLIEQVSIIQQWLIANGVGKGDVVAAYLPYLPETVIAMLATTSSVLFGRRPLQTLASTACWSGSAK